MRNNLLLSRVVNFLKLDKQDIVQIYFYSMLSGLVQLSVPLGIQTIINFVIAGSITASIILLISLVILGVFASGRWQVNQMKIIEKIQQKIFVRYAFEFSNKIPTLNLQKLDKYYIPELVNRFFDTLTLQKSVSKILLDIPLATIQIFVGLLLLSFYHPFFIGLGILLVIVLMALIYFTGNKGLASSVKESTYKYSTVAWMEELGRAIKSIKFFGNDTFINSRTDKNVTQYLASRTTHFNVLKFQYWTLIWFKLLITAGMLIVGCYLLVNNLINIGQFIASEIIIISVTSAVEKIILSLETVYDTLTSIEKLNMIVDSECEVEGKLTFPDNTQNYKIHLENVTYSYLENKSPILQQINLDIVPNSKLCIMGSYGSGKSTLLKLIAGLYTEYEGVIKINDIPSRDYTIKSLRKNMSILLSSTEIFDATVIENICFASDDASLLKVKALAEETGINSIIEDLPQSYHTPINFSGQQLSYKKMKLIMLLRALYKQSGVLLLDEPLEGISFPLKKKILDYLMLNDKLGTIIIASNDTAIAERCDNVILLEEGEVKAQGKFNEIKNLL